MKVLQLFREGKEILATDGIMYVNSSCKTSTLVNAVKNRNVKFAKNFPHKVADSFAIYANRIGSPLSKQISLN